LEHYYAAIASEALALRSQLRSTLATQRQLENAFQRRGIDFTRPGFYDQPVFKDCEVADPRFLENYAEYIHIRRFDEAYLEGARKLIPALANFLAAELAQDGRKGSCIDVSGAMMRILEREGIWSCMVGGATVVSFPPASGFSPAYFWTITDPPTTGHMWLFAPPFKVVDITLSMQPWGRGQENYIPRTILSEDSSKAEVDIFDFMDEKLVRHIERSTGRPPSFANISLRTRETMAKFPPFCITAQDVTIKYVPARIDAMDGSLDQMRNLQLNGRFPADLYTRFLETLDRPAADSVP
jgi:hypothetical protein